MYCAPTLTTQEFSTIHNAVCDLDSLVHRLDEVIKPELSLKLVKAINDIRRGLEGAYRQDNTAFDRKREHYQKIHDQLGLRSVWSMYEVDDLTERHSFEGADRVVYKDHWGEKPVQCSINGLTWVALWMAANACIRDSGDEHHVFIENFTRDSQDSRTLILSTGS